MAIKFVVIFMAVIN